MSIFRQHIGSLERKKELDKNAKIVKRKKGEYAPTRLFFEPRTPIKGRTKYKWGNLKDFYPPNLANPLTCRIPSLIDFLETRQPKYFFYTLEDWDFDNDINFPVEKELVCKAIMYWRLMLFTDNLDDTSIKIVKYYLNTANKIITSRMPIFGYWPYKNGLVHYYDYKKEDTYKDRNKKPYFISFNPDTPLLFLRYFDQTRDKLFQHERDIKLEKNLKKKEDHWTKVFKSIFEKKEIPGAVALKTSFNYQNLDLVVASYIAWEHNKLKPSKNEPKIKLLADWKQVYSIYKEVLFLKEKSPELFEADTVLVTELY
tara:strand:- start:97 stop:1035 length:939 start_codon:yes stop_codon:yes gene_type:complete